MTIEHDIVKINARLTDQGKQLRYICRIIDKYIEYTEDIVCKNTHFENAKSKSAEIAQKVKEEGIKKDIEKFVSVHAYEVQKVIESFVANMREARNQLKIGQQ